MARSTFYYHVKRLQEGDKHEKLRESIAKIFEHNKGRYGYRRVTCDLQDNGEHVNHKLVQRLMQEMHLYARKRTVKYKSYKGEVGKTAPNLLNRNFMTTGPNQKWATDVSQVNIKGEKMFLSALIDLYNGEVIAYTISSSPNLKMVMNMVNNAIKKFGDQPQTLNGLILHSDQGWHYQHLQYQAALKDNGIIQSMSRKGNCLDNAMMENFFGIMKKELFYDQEWESCNVFKKELIQYIEYYNNERIKLRLKTSPVKYRTRSNAS